MNDKAKSLLIVDDDTVYRQRLAQAMEKRGWAVRQAESVASGIAAAKAEAPEFAVVDLRLNDGSGRPVGRRRHGNSHCARAPRVRRPEGRGVSPGSDQRSN